MKKIIHQLQQIISSYREQLNQVSEKDFSEKPHPDTWSKKEELGHLIDSAHNNLRRFIVAQYEHQPKIVYDQNFWNKAANYQEQSSDELITLWTLLNKQICFVLDALPAESKEKMCNSGKDQPEIHTIKWLAEYYNKHLLHHLHHLVSLEKIPY